MLLRLYKRLREALVYRIGQADDTATAKVVWRRNTNLAIKVISSV